MGREGRGEGAGGRAGGERVEKGGGWGESVGRGWGEGRGGEGRGREGGERGGGGEGGDVGPKKLRSIFIILAILTLFAVLRKRFLRPVVDPHFFRSFLGSIPCRTRFCANRTLSVVEFFSSLADLRRTPAREDSRSPRSVVLAPNAVVRRRGLYACTRIMRT